MPFEKEHFSKECALGAINLSASHQKHLQAGVVEMDQEWEVNPSFMRRSLYLFGGICAPSINEQSPNTSEYSTHQRNLSE